MRAYCPVSFALKLAAVCLLAGLLVGVWLSTVWPSTAVRDAPEPDSRPLRAPPAQVADPPPESGWGGSAGEPRR